MIYLMAASLGSNLRNLIDDLFESWPKIASNGSTFAADAAAHVNVRDADTDLNICPDMILIRKFHSALGSLLCNLTISVYKCGLFDRLFQTTKMLHFVIA